MKIIKNDGTVSAVTRFYHVPKAAGTSITRGLNRSGIDVGKQRHYSTQDTPIDDSYFNITNCRNPFDRLVSAYYFIASGGCCRIDRRISRSIKVDTFGSFVLGFPEWENRGFTHFRPMSEWTGTDLSVFDHVIRFESLQVDWQSLSEKLGRPLIKLPHRRPGSHPEASELYTSAMRKVVVDYYATDFQLFGYDPGTV